MKYNPMKAIILAVICILVRCYLLNAQDANGKIQGRVLGQDTLPLSGASVTLITEKDSLFISATITDDNGVFVFDDIPSGGYRIVSTYLGGKKRISDPVQLSPGDTALIPDMVLEGSDIALAEVNVTGRMSFVEQKIDRTVVNVDALISNAGTNALDVLGKTPGVRVDPNGTINLRGRAGVMVYIDDRPTYLSGEELAAYLRSMPASSLEKIEVMPNPPAHYDAAGDAGILNIRTKKTRERGFNAGLDLGVVQHRHTATNNSLNFNFVNDKLKIYGNMGYIVQNGFADLTISRRFMDDSGAVTSFFDQFSAVRRRGYGFLSTLSAAYDLSEKSTLGIILGGQLVYPKSMIPNRSSITNADGTPDSSIVAENDERSHFRNSSINLNYRRKFSRERSDLSIDADYLSFRIARDQWFNNSGFQSDGRLSFFEQLSGMLGSDINIYSAKADYRHPFGGKLLLASGIKTSFTETDNIADYFYVIDNALEPDLEKTNRFRYRENIHALYLNANGDYERLSVQLGLRLESTEADGHQLGNAVMPDSTFTRNYTNLFPTVFMLYKMDSLENRQFRLSYGRRLERPYYQDLNPFITPIDRFTYMVGNPYLEPSFSNKLELSYIYKGRITTTVGYSDTRNLTSETIEIIDGIYYSRPGNIGETKVWNLSIDAGFNPISWLNFHLYGEIARLHSRSDFYTGLLDNKGYNGYLQGMCGVNLGEGWNMQLDGHYQTDIIHAQFVYGSKWGLNAGLSKKIANRASLRLSVSDIFYTNINRGVINNLDNTQASYRNVGDSRRVQLAISYRFGKTDMAKPNQESDSANEERNRVKL